MDTGACGVAGASGREASGVETVSTASGAAGEGRGSDGAEFAEGSEEESAAGLRRRGGLGDRGRLARVGAWFSDSVAVDSAVVADCVGSSVMGKLIWGAVPGGCQKLAGTSCCGLP